MSVSDIQDLIEKLRELREKNPDKFYELKSIVEARYLSSQKNRVNF